MTTIDDSYYISQDSGILYVSGYRKLPFRPQIPLSNTPTKVECEGIQFISMAQLCRITLEHGRGKKAACEAFGGDVGRNLVIPERQTWVFEGHNPSKFVLVSAVKDYLAEIGIDW